MIEANTMSIDLNLNMDIILFMTMLGIVVGNSGWERHPLEGYGSYPGEPNYYPHMHQYYE